jgi:hypothetical protein
LLAAAVFLFARFRSHAPLSFYQDDAFYYFQIARNLAWHHVSSFDGIHLTNGYHPLWMMLLVVLNLLASGKTFFVLVQTVAFASFVVSFLAARSLFRIISSDRMLTQAAASAVALQCLLLQSGMEVTLTLPLVLSLCCIRLRPHFHWTPRNATGYGLLCALVVLSRIDSIIFIAMLFLLDFALERPPDGRAWISRGYALLSCAVPLLLYFLSNRALFHVWMPISGQAKQLRLHHTFSLATIGPSLGPISFPFQVFIVYPTLCVPLLCIARLLKARGLELRPALLAVSISLIAFPFVQFPAFWTLSDWPIWPWYLYSFPLAATGCLLLLFSPSSAAQPVPRTSFALFLQTVVTLLFVVIAWTGTIDRDDNRTSWYLFAKDIEAFSKTHNGIYAMGDCAGTTGFLLHQPLIQLEGLVMDLPFLQNIRQQRNLNQVLESYGVRYYVTIRANLAGACYQTVEPILAGPDSPHMRGSFCQTPVAMYPHGDKTVYIFVLQPSSAALAASR